MVCLETRVRDRDREWFVILLQRHSDQFSYSACGELPMGRLALVDVRPAQSYACWHVVGQEGREGAESGTLTVVRSNSKVSLFSR